MITSQKIENALLIGAGLPLVIYLPMLAANAMLVSAARDGHVDGGLGLAGSLFLWGCTLYPVVFIGALLLRNKLKKRGRIRESRRCIAVPYAALALIAISFLFAA